MQEVMEKRAVELLEAGTVDRVLGWAAGEFAYDMTPAVFRTPEEVKARFVYNDFCGANLSKYLVKECKAGGKIAVFLKPCDTYSFNELLSEHRIKREMVYVIGIECYGKADVEKLTAMGLSGITGIVMKNGEYTVETVYGNKTVKAADVTADRCLACKSKKHVVYDELIGEDGEWVEDCNRFDTVEKLEAMTCVCSVGLDMIAIPGETKATTISGIIADEMAIGMVNQKTTAVRIIPVVGKGVGETVEFGGLLGYAPIMPVNGFSCDAFVNRKGRIPAPIHSFKN